MSGRGGGGPVSQTKERGFGAGAMERGGGWVRAAREGGTGAGTQGRGGRGGGQVTTRVRRRAGRRPRSPGRSSSAAVAASAGSGAAAVATAASSSSDASGRGGAGAARGAVGRPGPWPRGSVRGPTAAAGTPPCRRRHRCRRSSTSCTRRTRYSAWRAATRGTAPAPTGRTASGSAAVRS